MLENCELLNIKGGSKLVVAGVIGTVITFVIGVLDGYFRPLKCHGKWWIINY